MKQGKAKRSFWLLLLAAVLILLFAAALLRLPQISFLITSHWVPDHNLKEPSPVEKIPPAERNVYDLILLGARKEAEKKTRYDASYQVISYPGGDIDPALGACTDVIIRALRAAGFDLQQLIHEDMRENFDLYPQIWGLDGPDPNIDHRRTQNQMVFFERFGEKLTLEVAEATLDQWRHGDIVYWRFPSGEQHTGVISDRTNERGIPLVIHNSGIAREEDCLLRWEIIGHYRFPKEQ